MAQFKPSKPAQFTAPVKRSVTAADVVRLADALEVAALALRSRARSDDRHPDWLSGVLVTLAAVARAWNVFAARLGDAEAR
jgi:hypothetical protein